MAHARLLSREETDRIEAKIAAAERLTSAELRIAIVRSSWLGIKRRARKLFERHGLDKTAQRNGVLVVVDVKNHEIVIYGDEGVNNLLAQEFWDAVRDAMVDELRLGRLAEGLSIGIRLLAERLSQLFPANNDRGDELTNALIFD